MGCTGGTRSSVLVTGFGCTHSSQLVDADQMVSVTLGFSKSYTEQEYDFAYFEPCQKGIKEIIFCTGRPQHSALIPLCS